MTFNHLLRGSSNKTKAHCFFELLQLKTWDYLQVKQEKGATVGYGPILVSPGVFSFFSSCLISFFMVFF